MKSFFFASIIFCLALSQSRQALALNFVAHHNTMVQWLQREALSKLPPLLIEKLQDTTLRISLEPATDTEIAAWVRGTNTITLNQRVASFTKDDLLEKSASAWLPPTTKVSLLTHHRRLYDLLVGALIHEIVHVFDYRAFPHEEYRQRRKICLESAAIGMPIKEGECWTLLNLKRSISDAPEFLQLAGFPTRGFIFTDQRQLNTKWERSPDPYEFKSPEEALGVNMEFFLLDPEFQCRRPLLYDYFADYFHFQPSGKTACQSSPEVFVPAATAKHFSEQWEELRIDRLYQVQYLWAGPGPETMSRYGHAMLRLVFCAPYRTKVGPECLKDTFAHRILSFRAAVDDLDISSLKGLNGDYSSYLYILRASEVILEYTRTEGRKLYTLPLRLTRSEMQRLLTAALDAHWSYRGRYRFLANNCAHETWNLLQTALVYRAGINDKSTLRPDELYEMLIKIGLASPRLSIANEAAIPALLKLNSQQQLFDKNHQVLQRLGVAPGTSSAADFLKQKVETRKQWIINFLRKPDSPSRRRGLYALLNLSEYHLEFLISKWLKQYLISFVDTYSAPSATNLVRNNIFWPADATEFKALLLKLLNSQQLIPMRNHYGIPTASEIETLPINLVERRFDQMKSMSEALLQTFRAFLPPAQQQQWTDEENLVLNLRQALPMFKN